MLFFSCWLFFMVVVTVWANSWGRSGFVYFFVSLILSPLVGAIILLIQGKDETTIEENKAVAQNLKTCPHCAELIKREAKLCRYCQSDVSAAEEVEEEEADKVLSPPVIDRNAHRAICTRCNVRATNTTINGKHVCNKCWAV